MSEKQHKYRRRRLREEDTPPDSESESAVPYQQGGEGCIRFCEDHVCVPITPPGQTTEEWCHLRDLPDTLHPVTGKSYKDIWEAQKDILREALRMEGGRFVYSLIVFCWMRGEGKSLLACLVQIWKFFCFPRQKIMLGANSKDQVKFVHYDIIRDIIRNSPKLLAAVGEKNIQEKEIRLVNRKKEIVSLIRSISSFSGIVSNITGYTFSEIFDMKNPKFFVQLDGSIRNMPNSLGVIDSTVSEKSHLLYQLYEKVKKGETQRVYFSYRYSELASPSDYWNPNMDEAQLNDYKAKFPFGEFERYFQNLWEAGQVRVFTDEMIEEMSYLGVGNSLSSHNDIVKLLEQKKVHERTYNDSVEKGWMDGAIEAQNKMRNIEARFRKVEDVYDLRESPFQNYPYVPLDVLNELGDLYNTDWAVLAGTDFSDPMAIYGQARTFTAVIAKGLADSKNNPHVLMREHSSLKFIYFVLCLVHIEDETIDSVKDLLGDLHEEYLGIDVFCSERYGSSDMLNWCEERDLPFEPIHPSYNVQRDSFKEMYHAVKEGRFKCPTIHVPGYKKDDVFREELEVFIHDSAKKWFGSPQKQDKNGIQDDSVYAINWAQYGGRFLGPADFRVRQPHLNFGEYIGNPNLIANY